jgi:hypothetical protein
VANLARVQFERATPDGDALSPLRYCWAPDGTIDAVFGELADESGQTQVKFQPNEPFVRYVLNQFPSS